MIFYKIYLLCSVRSWNDLAASEPIEALKWSVWFICLFQYGQEHIQCLFNYRSTASNFKILRRCILSNGAFLWQISLQKMKWRNKHFVGSLYNPDLHKINGKVGYISYKASCNVISFVCRFHWTSEYNLGRMPCLYINIQSAVYLVNFPKRLCSILWHKVKIKIEYLTCDSSVISAWIIIQMCCNNAFKMK